MIKNYIELSPSPAAEVLTVGDLVHFVRVLENEGHAHGIQITLDDIGNRITVETGE